MSDANEAISLSQLNPGDRGRILSIDCEGPLRRRLMDMGLTPGTEVCIEGAAPLGDPLIVCARGCRLGLRRGEAAGISVIPCADRPCSEACKLENHGPFRRRHRHGQVAASGDKCLRESGHHQHRKADCTE